MGIVRAGATAWAPRLNDFADAAWLCGAVPTLRGLNLNWAGDTHLGPGQSGAIMTDQQSGKSKPAVARRIVLLGAIATALGVINMLTNGAEAQSSAVMILQYGALALGLFALVGGLIMMVMAPSDSQPQ